MANDPNFLVLKQLEPADEIALQYLGASVMANWRALPAGIRDDLLRDTGIVVGLPASTGLQEQIKGLLRRHDKLEG